MIRVLFIVLLSLGLVTANPTEVGPALSALYLRATGTDEGDRSAAFRVRTPLAALFEVDLVEFALHQLVFIGDVGDHRTILSLQVDSVNEASLKRVDMLLAVEAEMMLAVLTSASVFILLNHGDTTAGGDRTPAHIVHGFDGVLDAKTLILIHH